MKLPYSLTQTRWPLGALALLGLLGLARSAHAQAYNTGTLYNTGDLYHNGGFTNAGSTASFSNAGASAVVRYAGPTTATFTNTSTATYTATSGATDLFIGPNGAAGAQEIAGSVAPSFYNLTFANGTAAAFNLTNTAGADVAHTLTLSNGITTTTTTVAGALRLATNAAVSGTTSNACYIDGYVGKAGTSPFTYPLGATNQVGGNGVAAGDAVYAPITISSPGGTTLRYLAAAPPATTTLATQSAALQLKTVSTYEYYPVSVGTVPAGTSLTLPYGNFSTSAAGTPYGSDPNLLTVAAYDGTGWTNLSATPSNGINTTAKTVTVTLPTDLSPTYTALTLASTSGAPLPVTLVSFTATKKGIDGTLRWRTASERNSAYFDLQASRDGTAWHMLTQVAAAGTSTTARDYSYLDPGLARYGVPVIYYRLRQLDLGGEVHYSPVVSLSPDVAPWQVSAYPNPFDGDLTAQLTTAETGPVTLTVLDAGGRQVLQRKVSAIPGNQVFVLDAVHTVATGTYTLLVCQNGHVGTVRVVRE